MHDSYFIKLIQYLEKVPAIKAPVAQVPASKKLAERLNRIGQTARSRQTSARPQELHVILPTLRDDAQLGRSLHIHKNFA